MKNNLHKLILSTIILLFGIFGTFLIKYLPTNIIGVLFLVFLGIFRYGGLLLFIVYLIRIFSEEKKENSLEEKIIKRNKSLTYAIVFLVFGLFFCCSIFFTSFLCNENDNICAIKTVGIDVLFFVPIGVVLIGTGLLKLYRFLKTDVKS